MIFASPYFNSFWYFYHFSSLCFLLCRTNNDFFFNILTLMIFKFLLLVFSETIFKYVTIWRQSLMKIISFGINDMHIMRLFMRSEPVFKCIWSEAVEYLFNNQLFWIIFLNFSSAFCTYDENFVWISKFNTSIFSFVGSRSDWRKEIRT